MTPRAVVLWILVVLLALYVVTHVSGLVAYAIGIAAFVLIVAIGAWQDRRDDATEQLLDAHRNRARAQMRDA
jgi:cytochrome oxidase assembly protein ShyY1